jgi:hypothetical protein
MNTNEFKQLFREKVKRGEGKDLKGPKFYEFVNFIYKPALAEAVCSFLASGNKEALSDFDPVDAEEYIEIAKGD